MCIPACLGASYLALGTQPSSHLPDCGAFCARLAPPPSYLRGRTCVCCLYPRVVLPPPRRSFNLLLSTLPPLILRIVAALGFPSNRAVGIQQLTQCVRGRGVRYGIAALALLGCVCRRHPCEPAFRFVTETGGCAQGGTF